MIWASGSKLSAGKQSRSIIVCTSASWDAAVMHLWQSAGVQGKQECAIKRPITVVLSGMIHCRSQ